MTRRLNGRALVCLFLMALAAAAILQAMKWPLSARLFPTIVSVALFLFATTELGFNLLGASAKGKESEKHDPQTERKHALITFGWCLSFFALVVLLGFSITIPLFVFLYTKAYGKERWAISLVLSALAGAMFYGLFIWTLNVHFEPGLLQEWLTARGVL